MSHGSQNWFELSGVSRNRGFEKSGVKFYSLSEANPRETRFGSRYREVRETEGSRNQDSTVVIFVWRMTYFNKRRAFIACAYCSGSNEGEREMKQ